MNRGGDTKLVALGDATRVRGLLAMAGYRSITEWAIRHGINPVTARRVIYDWANRDDREPHGGIAREVMRKLRKTVGGVSAQQKPVSEQKEYT